MAGDQSSGGSLITTLPNELLNETSSLIDKPSLLYFALTSTKVNLSATDILYRTYINRRSPSIAPFALFLRTLCERPDLAKKVRVVKIRGWQSETEIVNGTAWRGVTTVAEEDTVTRSGRGRSYKPTDFKGNSKLFVEVAVKAGLIVERCSLVEAKQVGYVFLLCGQVVEFTFTSHV
jgi:hypothetical protein